MTDSIGVLGARSFIGECLFNIAQDKNRSFTAFSRRKIQTENKSKNISWQILANSPPERLIIRQWICLAPIWILPDYFAVLESYGIERIVVLSSTSRFTKITSSDAKEQVIVKQLIEGEARLIKWAEQQQIEWVILRPTLIYGLGKDKNISTIINFIKRFGFFPLFGLAKGKRQPIHADDVANACVQVLNTPTVINKSYNITGEETLTYDAMVKRVFKFLDRKCFIVYVPIVFFRIAFVILRHFPRFKNLNVAMAERMSQDLVFDSCEAQIDFKFSARDFILGKSDVL